MGRFESVSILDMQSAVGEEALKRILSDFSCPLNEEVEHFVRNNALEFAKKKISITYLVIDEEGRIAGIFTLTHKPMQVTNKGMSGGMRKRAQRHAQLDENTDAYMMSSFLIAQSGKNFQHDISLITGQELMDLTMLALKDIQNQIGGGMVYLECEEKPQLLNFYQGEKNGFRIFGERYSEKDEMKYIQLLKFF